MKMCIEPTYFDPKFKDFIHDQFNNDGYGVCGDFFKSAIVDDLSDEIFSNDLKWEIKGPLNKM